MMPPPRTAPRGGGVLCTCSRLPLLLLLLAALLMTEPAVAACPAGCLCANTIVDCSGAQLTAVPQGVPANTTRLLLYSNKINSFVPADLPALPALQRLDLRSNPFSSLAADAFQGAPSLRTLNLSNVPLTSISSEAFNGLSQLQRLDVQVRVFGGRTVSFRPLTALEELTVVSSFARNLIPATSLDGLTALRRLALQEFRFSPSSSLFPLGGLTSLETLDLSNTRVILPEDTFDGLTRLQTLSLKGHQGLGELTSRPFADLTSLMSLDLRDGGITTWTGTPIATLTKLQTLVVGDNKLTFLAKEALTGPTGLRDLLLDHNELTAIEPGAFDAITQLKNLFLQHNSLDASVFEVFSNNNGLEALLLDNNDITVIPNTANFDLPFLKRLSLFENDLTQLPAGTFSRLTSLEVLNLDGNQLSTLPEGLFSTLTQLRTLSGSANQLRVLNASIFKGLTRLDTFELMNNAITSIGPNTFSALTSLRILDLTLAGTTLSTLNETVFQGLGPTLEVLRLRGVGLETLPRTMFQTLTALKELDLSGNRLTRLPDGLNSATALEFLKLGGNQLTAMPNLRVWPALKRVELRDNDISIIPQNAFGGLTKLAIIDLSGNRIDRILPGGLANLPGLEKVFLDNNQLSFIEPGALPVVARRSLTLSMSGNPSTCTLVQTASGSVYSTLQCACADGTAGDGTFCEEQPFGCLSGTSDVNGNQVCVNCVPGQYAPFGSVGPCQNCSAGTVDSDQDPSTPCVQCAAPGQYVPPGSKGQCTDFVCAAGTVDHDNDASTPCVALCDLCSCDEADRSVDCSGLGLAAFPNPRGIPADTRSLALNDNELTDIPESITTSLPFLVNLNLNNNNIAVFSPAVASWAQRQALDLTMADNPTVCAFYRSTNQDDIESCFCAPGLVGDSVSCVPATSLSPCPAGFVDHDSSTTTSCLPCTSPGLYVPPGSFGSCGEYVCPIGQTDHDSDSSTPCRQCDVGTFVPAASSGSCVSLQCEAGTTDHDALPASACFSCSRGQYLAQGSFGACEAHLCPPGFSDHDEDPATECLDCGVGHFVPAGSFGKCADFECAAGTVDADNNAATPCVNAPRGHFAPARSNGLVQSFQCPAGFIDNDFDSTTVCVSCSGNVYVPAGQAGECSSFLCEAPKENFDNDASTPCAELASSSDGLSGGAVAGVVVAMLLLLLIVVFAARRYVRRNAVEPPKPHDFAAEVNELGVRTKVLPREIPRDAVMILAVIGKGAFGEVCKAVLNETLENGLPSYLVAVKRFDEDRMSPEEKKKVFREAALLAQIQSPFVVSLVGVVTEGDPIYLVLQYCELGSLDTWLVQRKEAGEEAELLLNVRAQIAHDVAAGMQVLAENSIVHRDLAARNVLIGSDRRAKVSDFGHARDLEDDDFYQSEGGQIAVRWTAPEALKDKKYTTKSDVWSYGVTVWEIWADGEKPYKGKKNQEVWMSVVNLDRKLRMPRNTPRYIAAEISACWHKDPDRRPDFASLKQFWKLLLNGDMDALGRSVSMSSKRSGSVTSAGTLSSSMSRSPELSRRSTANSMNSLNSISPGPESAPTPDGSENYVEFISDEAAKVQPPLFVPMPPARSRESLTHVGLTESPDPDGTLWPLTERRRPSSSASLTVPGHEWKQSNASINSGYSSDGVELDADGSVLAAPDSNYVDDEIAEEQRRSVCDIVVDHHDDVVEKSSPQANGKQKGTENEYALAVEDKPEYNGHGHANGHGHGHANGHANGFGKGHLQPHPENGGSITIDMGGSPVSSVV